MKYARFAARKSRNIPKSEGKGERPSRKSKEMREQLSQLL